MSEVSPQIEFRTIDRVRGIEFLVAALSPKQSFLFAPFTGDVIMPDVQRRGSAVLGAALLMLIAGPAAAQFREMADRVPRSANAIVLLNVEKILQSPKAAEEGWKGNIEKAFDAGMTRFHPKSLRYVLAGQIDYEFMKSQWSAAVIDFAEEPSLAEIAKQRSGTPDKIGDVPALVLPTDAYVFPLGPKTLGASRRRTARRRRAGSGKWSRRNAPPCRSISRKVRRTRTRRARRSSWSWTSAACLPKIAC
jgi:hypothetical protein